MRRGLAAVVAGACIAVLAAQGCTGKQTVSGQVIDLACYTRNAANTGLDHDRARACAMACAKWEGQPVGILTSDGKVYQVSGELAASDNAKIVPYLAHTVSMTGTVTEQDGMMMIAGDQVEDVK